MSMVRRGRYVFVCPDCGGTTWSVSSRVGPGRFRDTTSLVDGRQYPSCRQVEQLCYRCLVSRWGDEESLCMGFPKAPVGAADSASSTLSALDAGPLSDLPELWDFLTTCSMPDGTPRMTGRLSLCFESGVIKLSLTDDHTRQYASMAGRRLGDLLAEVDLRLGDNSLPWRPSSFARGKAKK